MTDENIQGFRGTMANDGEIRVGTPVRFKYGVETVRGIVKEDRGRSGGVDIVCT